MPLLSIENIDVTFGTEPPVVKGININIEQGKLTAVVGESGSGKSVTAMSVLQLLPKSTVYANGRILFEEKKGVGINLLQVNDQQLQTIRGNRIAMIFQEPMSSLNPVMTCGKQVLEVVLQHQKISVADAKQQVINWFEKVQLSDPAGMYHRYPHQISGGQKQRVMIAMAASCQPALLICDEPTTALDVTVQKQILQLIKSLQLQNKMGVLFITHDLGLVSEIADDIAVMYKGNIVEKGSVGQIFTHPQHPYTKALLACRPALYSKGERLPVVNDFLSNHLEPPINNASPISIKNEVSVLPTPEPIIEVKNSQGKLYYQKKFIGKSNSYL